MSELHSNELERESYYRKHSQGMNQLQSTVDIAAVQNGDEEEEQAPAATSSPENHRRGKEKKSTFSYHNVVVVIIILITALILMSLLVFNTSDKIQNGTCCQLLLRDTFIVYGDFDATAEEYWDCQIIDDHLKTKTYWFFKFFRYKEMNEHTPKVSIYPLDIQDRTLLDSMINRNNKQFVSGRTLLCGNDIIVDHNEKIINVPSNYTLTQIIRNDTDYNITQRRRLNTFDRTIGEKTFLAVRVEALDIETTINNETALSENLFGSINDPLTPLTQIQACSYNKLSFIPAEGGRINNGVITVTLNQNISGLNMGSVKDLVLNKLDEEFDDVDELADHVMILCPPGAPGYAYGVAYTNHYLSWCRDTHCVNPTVLSHELGHNIGLAHSGINGNDTTSKYLDSSCTMGFGIYQGGAFSNGDHYRRCFNAVKNYFLEWYDDRQVAVNPLVSDWNGAIVGLSDYENSSDDEVIVLKLIDSPTNVSYYVSFNRASGINTGTQRGQDKVLIHSSGNQNTSTLSILNMTLNITGDEFVIPNYGNNRDVKITLNAIIEDDQEPWYASVSVTS